MLVMDAIFSATASFSASPSISTPRRSCSAPVANPAYLLPSAFSTPAAAAPNAAAKLDVGLGGGADADARGRAGAASRMGECWRVGECWRGRFAGCVVVGGLEEEVVCDEVVPRTPPVCVFVLFTCTGIGCAVGKYTHPSAHPPMSSYLVVA